MIKKITIKNFRGIQSAEMELAPMTIFTGANNSGKSSIMYSLLVLKNILSNTNQPLDSFFDIGFLNLGGFKENVFLKQEEKRKIEIGITTEDSETFSNLKMVLGKQISTFNLNLKKPLDVALSLETSFPYALNKPVGTTLTTDDWSAKITWNGIAPQITLETKGPQVETQSVTKQLSESLIASIEEIKRVDVIPLKRGFSQPTFKPTTYSPQMLKEDEIASLLANDRELESDVEFYLEKIVNKKFSARQTSLGASSFYLQTKDKETAFVCDLVNEGFGTNQLIYLLAKILRPGQDTICIEEPEIHLNPAAVDSLAKSLSDIANERQKTILISTHSEHFIVSLLNLISQKRLSTDDVRLYHIHREGKESKITSQEINAKGQIKGGLKGFYDVELKQLREFLNVPEEA
ncbi:MAG: AAA family ATPase [Ignavibacteria bacterium]|nr:AAA family ATPase [Ignavibacteria bacterium]